MMTKTMGFLIVLGAAGCGFGAGMSQHRVGVSDGPSANLRSTEFTIYDVQVGDTVEFDAAASLIEERGEWVLRANATIEVRFPFPVERLRGDAWETADDRVTVESLDLLNGPVRFRKPK